MRLTHQRIKTSETQKKSTMRLSVFLLAGLLLSSSFVSAQAIRNQVEKANDRNQIRNDQATIDRDRKEIRDFNQHRRQLGDAVKSANQDAAHLHHHALIAAMEREIAQGQGKINSASREVKGSASEVRSDNREVRRDKNQGKPLQAMDDRRDRRDDVRDLKDDVNDRNELIARNNRQKEILAVFKDIKVKGNPNAFAAIKAKQSLLDEFETTMIRDMGENWEELSEDKTELREDRRETREDRRQR